MVGPNFDTPIYHSNLFIFLMRISKVITKEGDKGQTSLGNGIKVSKNHPRVRAMGSIDKLNSLVGWTICIAKNNLKNDLQKIQQDLFNLGGELAIPNGGMNLLGVTRLEWLETQSEALNETLSPLKEFILPGGTELSARIHITRAECRSAELDLVALGETEKIETLHRKYLNRLSDYLFILARVVKNEEGSKEVTWDYSK